MKKGVLLLVLFFVVSLPFAVSAETLSGTIPCDGGGSLEFSGSYNALTGSLDLLFTFNDCAFSSGENDTNGTIHTTGTFRFVSASTASVDITSASELSFSGDADASISCSNSVNGTYDFATEVLSGNIASNCTGSGSANFDLLSLLFGADPYLQ